MAKKNLMIMVPTLRGGGQERVAATLTYLLADVYNVKVLVYDGRSILYDIACEYRSLDLYNETSSKLSKIIIALKRIRATRQLKKELQTDICLSFGPSCDYTNALSAEKDKVYLSLRGFKALSRSSRLSKLFTDFLYSKADGIISVSKVMTVVAQERYPKHAHKFSTLYNPHDHERIVALKDEPIDKYQDLFAGDSRVIMGLGSYRTVKGQWHLIKAFAMIKQTQPDVKLLILGGEAEASGKLKKLVKDLGLEQEVVLGGFEKNPFRYLAKAEMFILSSLNEGLPNSVLEAMSSGLPVIATDCLTGPREILTDGDVTLIAEQIEEQSYGILIPSLTETANYDPLHTESCQVVLAEAIQRYLDNPELATHYQQRSLERAQFFSKEACKQEIIRIFEQ